MEKETSETRLHFSPLTTEVFLPDIYVYIIVHAHKAATHGAVFLHNNPVLTMFSSSNYQKELNFCSMALFYFAPPTLVASGLPDIIVDTTDEYIKSTAYITASQSFSAVVRRLAQVLSLRPPPISAPVSYPFFFLPSLQPYAGSYPCALLHTWSSQLESSTHFLTS